VTTFVKFKDKDKRYGCFYLINIHHDYYLILVNTYDEKLNINTAFTSIEED
jgi:hypothetical protein